MKKITFLFLIALILSGCATPVSAVAPTATSQPAAAPSLPAIPTATAPTEAPKRVQMFNIPAPSLKNNMLGEPAERQIVVYLPPSYSTSQKRFPVVYYLPGFQESFLSLSLPGDLDTAIQDGKSKEIIFVVANGQNTLGGSFYVNSPVTGNWEDFIVQDVVGYIDSNYRTLAKAGSRAITGFSMGGYGSLNIAMKHPDLFGMVYSMSPGLFDEKGLAESQMYVSDTAPARLLQTVEEMKGLDAKGTVDKMRVSMDSFTFAYGAAFAGDPSLPGWINFPYTMKDGKPVRNEAVWKIWESGYGGVKDEATQYKDNWLKLKGIGLNYGKNDSYGWIPKGCAYFEQEMKAAGIKVSVTTYAGGHEGFMKDRVVNGMLPFLSNLLETE